MTYFFTNGRYNTSNLIAFDWAQLLGHFQATMPMGALVRILVRVQGNDEASARQISDEFAQATVPAVLESLRQARLKPN